jgi:hypothetical protein
LCWGCDNLSAQRSRTFFECAPLGPLELDSSRPWDGQKDSFYSSVAPFVFVHQLPVSKQAIEQLLLERTAFVRRLFLILIGFFATTGLLISSALADSPHFISAGTASINNSGAYVVSGFKEAGLGNTTTTEMITLSIGTAQATYACVNGGGKHPQAANKETVQKSLTTTGAFPVRNGQTTGSISAGPPGPGLFMCPPGQKFVLAFVSYSNVKLIGLHGDTAAEPDLSACLTSVEGIC